MPAFFNPSSSLSYVSLHCSLGSFVGPAAQKRPPSRDNFAKLLRSKGRAERGRILPLLVDGGWALGVGLLWAAGSWSCSARARRSRTSRRWCPSGRLCGTLPTTWSPPTPKHPASGAVLRAPVDSHQAVSLAWSSRGWALLAAHWMGRSFPLRLPSPAAWRPAPPPARSLRAQPGSPPSESSLAVLLGQARQ